MITYSHTPSAELLRGTAGYESFVTTLRSSIADRLELTSTRALKSYYKILEPKGFLDNMAYAVDVVRQEKHSLVAKILCARQEL